jgi:anti-sigma regulatory factor (Ser/Thr protein kinase)
VSDDRLLASVRVPGRIESVRPAACFLVEFARSVGVPAAADRLFEVAIVEAITNALNHNPRSPEACLECEFEFDGIRAVVRVLDEAARVPLAVTIPAGHVPWSEPGPSWEQIPESGYGLYLMRAVFPEIRPVSRGALHGIELALTV